MNTSWKKAQEWEHDWWSDCTNTLNEEIKQQTYAKYMGLNRVTVESGYPYDIAGKSIIDIGGGPVSLLLKTINRGKCAVVDPCDYPEWTMERYRVANIEYIKMQGEDIDKLDLTFDSAFIYNVLQHTENPELIIKKALEKSKELRIFEWVDAKTNIGHPHTLTEEKLNKWIGKPGIVITLNGENNCFGKAYYGIFKSKTFKENRI